MVCHGELAQRKPHPRYLTLYFLMVSLGGAIGGLFVALVAPRIFPNYWEMPIAITGRAESVKDSATSADCMLAASHAAR